MRYPNGLFGWVDLMTSDVEAARSFYAGLFGWESVDMPTPMGPAYTMLSLDGQLVAGMSPIPPNAAGMPSVWGSYLMVAELDAELQRAVQCGGSILMPAMDVMDQGRMAMIADPSGAALGLWQPMAHQGADVFNKPGTLTWNELQTRDLAAAKQFYSDWLGWTWAGAEGEYLTGSLVLPDGTERMNCGAMPMPPMVPAMVPSFWAVYFAVEDCDAALAKAVELGGSIFVPAMDVGPGRFGGVADPTGAMFMLGSFTG